MMLRVGRATRSRAQRPRAALRRLASTSSSLAAATPRGTARAELAVAAGDRLLGFTVQVPVATDARPCLQPLPTLVLCAGVVPCGRK